MNLLSLFNSSLAKVYCTSNNRLIRFKILFDKVIVICAISYFSFAFNTSYMCPKFDVMGGKFSKEDFLREGYIY
jgi:hypothetical protein